MDIASEGGGLANLIAPILKPLATGLEFFGVGVILIGADIIATIIAPLTWESVGLLGLIVLIRTFLSFSLEAEIDGQWPWSRNAQRGSKAD